VTSSSSLLSKKVYVLFYIGTGKSRTIAGIVLRLLGKLPKTGRRQKILLCAPSNNACDELSRRILDEFQTQEIEYKHGE
jgi:superfamily I DNA and/or RNA helicase